MKKDEKGKSNIIFLVAAPFLQDNPKGSKRYPGMISIRSLCYVHFCILDSKSVLSVVFHCGSQERSALKLLKTRNTSLLTYPTLPSLD